MRTHVPDRAGPNLANCPSAVNDQIGHNVGTEKVVMILNSPGYRLPGIGKAAP